MSVDRLNRYQKTLSHLSAKSRHRELSRPAGIDFTSNDYLSLANSSRIKNAIKAAIENGVPIGSGGSRLLRGNHEIFETLETKAAQFFKSESALYFNSGYTANRALFSTLPQRGDVIIYDELVHASILDGIAESRADSISVRHNDIDAFAKAVKTWRKQVNTGCAWFAVESLYSMDGDFAPLKELIILANEQDSFLVIDEAHATGIFGENGEGLASFCKYQDNVVTVHTCGKALGVSGALLCLNHVFRDYLINRARAFIYSTAPSPLSAVGVIEALNILADEPERRTTLNALTTIANKQMACQLGLTGSGSPILPVHIGNNVLAMRIAHRLQQSGFDIRAIRPPTVAEGNARLRLAITLNVTENDIHLMMSTLSELLKEMK